MGKTSTAYAPPSPTGKHPHLRGENQVSSWIGLYFGETSPPAWGKLRERVLDSITAGNIPTCVGKTGAVEADGVTDEETSPPAWGKLQASSPVEDSVETSPPAWGKLKKKRRLRAMCRNIPTCVGKTGAVEADGVTDEETSPPAWGKLQASSPVEDSVETSPPAWGKLKKKRRLRAMCRNIPTCVGKTAKKAIEANLE